MLKCYAKYGLTFYPYWSTNRQPYLINDIQGAYSQKKFIATLRTIRKTNVYVYHKDRDKMIYDMSRILLYQTQKFTILLVFSIMAIIILLKVSFIFP